MKTDLHSILKQNKQQNIKKKVVFCSNPEITIKRKQCAVPNTTEYNNTVKEADVFKNQEESEK